MRIFLTCLIVACLGAAVLAQVGTGSSSGMDPSGGASMMGGAGGLFPLLALSQGGSDAMGAMYFCGRGINLLCLMMLNGGI